MYSKQFLTAFLVLTLALFSCKKKDDGKVTSATCNSTISYAASVAPMISQNCSTSGCHNSANAGGYNLTTHLNVSANAEIILKSIRHSGAKAMPQGGAKLATSIADEFDCWIQQGKLDN